MTPTIKEISKEDIMIAVDFADRETIDLTNHFAYEVLVNGKSYSPKELLRYAYLLKTGNEIGSLFSNEEINNYYRELDFEVKKKIDIWKLGCHWERGNPSFYEFIKQEGIVISVQQFPFGVGDLILITEGFTVYAIAKVVEELEPVTHSANLENRIDYYHIPFEDNILYAKAEWYELSKTEIFIYQLQQGIRKVHRKDILDRTIDIWDNKNLVTGNLPFYSTRYRGKIELTYPCLALYKRSWDDYLFKTSYELYHHITAEDSFKIGNVKILSKSTKDTELELRFSELDESYCSLGQTLRYYENLKARFPDSYIQILKKLRDCSYDSDIRAEFENTEGFTNSLLRSSEAQLSLNEGRRLLEGLEKFRHSFKFQHTIGKALEPHVVEFNFNQDDELQNTFCCIIGKNGTGKTQFISQLANKLTDITEQGEFYPGRPEFSKIIAISFSFFDDFKLPEVKDISYEFIGLKSKDGILDRASIVDLTWQSFMSVSQSKSQKSLFLKALEDTIDISNLGFTIDVFNEISTEKEFNTIINTLFSSGQKVIVHLLARLVSLIDTNSLIIFDEPETHLHPNMVGRLLRVLNYVLKINQSFCVLSTHSPIIIQEIPAKYISIFKRQENTPVIFPPVIETLGENLSNINDSIFQVDQENALFQEILASVRHLEIGEIEAILKRKLSLNARLYLQTLNSQLDG